MNSFLDKYLTTPPDDDFSEWCEAVCARLSDGFFKSNEEWVTDDSGIAYVWLSKLYNNYTSAFTAAAIIERAFSMVRYKEIKLIKQAHHNLTRKVGKPEYAPTTREIEEEIKRMISAIQ